MLTTASDHILRPFRRNRFLQALAIGFVIAWLVAAINPENRFDWLLENLLVFAAVLVLVYLDRTRPLSDLSYFLIFLFLLLHLLGAHYTYSKTPIGFWLQDLFAQDRNHYDRIVHFSFGLFIVYPVRELLIRYAGTSPRLGGYTAFATIATLSSIYEIIEWIVAILVDPAAAAAYLGTQGDVFDAQKDAGLAIIGAVLTLVAIWFFSSKNAV